MLLLQRAWAQSLVGELRFHIPHIAAKRENELQRTKGKHQLTILYPLKLYFKSEGNIKTFSDKQKSREFIASRRRAQQPTPVFLPGESHRQRSLASYSPQGCKDLDMTELTNVHTLPGDLSPYR